MWYKRWIIREEEYVYRLNDDNYIVVTFEKECIRFSINNIPTPSDPKVFHQIYPAISLLSPKETGNDISDVANAKIAYLERLISIDKHPYCEDFPINKNIFPIVFLEFISELEDEKSIFINDSNYECVKKKLHKSIIYRLLAAKLFYYKHIPYKRIPKESTEYNKRVTEYSDLLMDPKLTSILPPKEVGKDSFFHNPEYELQRIIDKNIDIQKEEQTETYIDPNVRKKIQNYFFRKHSTISAYYSRTGKIVYWIIWCIMIFWVCCVIGKCLCTSSTIDNYKCLLYSGIAISGLFFINAFFNWNSNSFFPRICIALVAAWSLIVLSGDFVFSHLLGKNSLVIWGIPAVSGLMILFVLLVECRAHSPYYPKNPFNLFCCSFWKECNWKIIPILSFSLFLSLLMGMFIQLATFKPLLAAGNTLTQVTFSSNFNKIEHHKNNVQLLIDDLESYKSEIIVAKTHNVSNENLLYLQREKHIKTFFNDSIIKDLYCVRMDSIFRIKALTIRMDSIDILLSDLHTRMINLHHFTAIYCNTDSLLRIISTESYYFKNTDSDSLFCECFLKNDSAKKDISCVPMPLSWIDDGEQLYLFPKLLVFHAFIALLIAFIVQMIVSGKTVTEGL